MKSPCVKICQMDPKAGLCIGCGRTLDEIARWAQMSGDDRNRVLAELAQRLNNSRRMELRHAAAADSSGSVPEFRG
jgi:uncharacterized protein